MKPKICKHHGLLTDEDTYVVESGLNKGRKRCRLCSKISSTLRYEKEKKEHVYKTYSPVCEAPGCQNKKKIESRLCPMHDYRRKKYNSFEIPEKQKLPEGIVKICYKHGELQRHQVTTCGKNRQNSFRCKECSYSYRGKTSSKNNRKHFLKLKYKLSQSDYEILLKKQNGLCAICNQPEITKNPKGQIKKLAIDHCHESEMDGILKIRGLLCTRCNPMLGYAKDSIEILKAAIEYLQKDPVLITKQ